jgi:regulator-associated protein of mTOR
MCLCIAKLWENFELAKSTGAQEGIPQLLCSILDDPVPEVRVAAVYALGLFMGGKAMTTRGVRDILRDELELDLGLALSRLVADGSPLVRREVVIALAELVYHHQHTFVELASEPDHDHRKAWYIWKCIAAFAHDPFPSVCTAAVALRTYIKSRSIFETQLGHTIGMPSRNGTSSSTTGTASHSLASSISRTAPHSAASSPPSSAVGSPEGSPHASGPNGISAADGNGTENGDGEPPTTGRPLGRLSGAPMKHFDRYKMSALRTGLPSAGTLRRSDQKTAVLNAMDSKQQKRDLEVDERHLDPTWTVPKSTCYERSASYMTTCLLTPEDSKVDPPMSVMVNKRYRTDRNRQAFLHSQSFRHGGYMKEKNKSFVEVGVLTTEWEQTSSVIFHPYEPLLAAADNNNNIAIYDYHNEERGRERISSWRNDSARHRISTLQWINDLHTSLLCAASDDGVVRIWRDPHIDGKQKLVSAWVANPSPDRQSPMSAIPSPHQVQRRTIGMDGDDLTSTIASTTSFTEEAWLSSLSMPTLRNASTGLLTPSASMTMMAGRDRATSRVQARHSRPPLVVDWQQSKARLVTKQHIDELHSHLHILMLILSLSPIVGKWQWFRCDSCMGCNRRVM